MGTTITLTGDIVTLTITGDGIYTSCTYDRLDGWYGDVDVDLGLVKRPNAPGAFAPEQVFPGEAVISIEGDYFGADRQAALRMREDLTALYNEGRPITMTVADDLRTTHREVLVARVGLPWTIHPEFEFSIDMTAPDPRRYADPVTVGTTLAVAGSGLQLPSNEATGVGLLLPSNETPNPDLGIDFGTVSTSGRVTVTNQGNTATTSKMVVSGGSMTDGFDIVNVATGQRLSYIATVPTGSTVTIDGDLRTAFINDFGPAGRWLVAAQGWWTTPARSSHELAFIARGATTGNPRLDAITASAFQ